MASLEYVPAELRAEARWVCWRREERGGKATKIPVCAANGRMATKIPVCAANGRMAKHRPGDVGDLR